MNRILKAKIIEKCGTQVDFAEIAKVRESFVSRIVRGRRTLNAAEQIRWAALLDADREKLFSNRR